MSIRNRINLFLSSVLSTSIQCTKGGILLGRKTTGAGSAEEITIGTGLELTEGKVLNATGGPGGGVSDVGDLTTTGLTAGNTLRVAAGGGLEERTPAETLVDIGAKPLDDVVILDTAASNPNGVMSAENDDYGPLSLNWDGERYTDGDFLIGVESTAPDVYVWRIENFDLSVTGTAPYTSDVASLVAGDWTMETGTAPTSIACDRIVGEFVGQACRLGDGPVGYMWFHWTGYSWDYDAEQVKMAQNKLAGRGNSQGTGPLQAINLGTNLSMTGTTLNAAGGTMDQAAIQTAITDKPAFRTNIGALENTNTAVNAAIAEDPAATRNSMEIVAQPAKLGATIARIGYERQFNNVPYQFVVCSMGDSWAIDDLSYLPMFGFVSGEGGMAGTDRGVNLTNTQFTGDNTRTFGQGLIINSTVTTATMNLARWMYRAAIFYVAENGAGTFRVEQQIGGGAWTDLTTGQATAANPVNADNGGAIDCGVLEIDWGTNGTATKKLRVIHISGNPVYIIGSHYTETPGFGSGISNGGCEYYMNALGGLTVSQQADVSQALYDGLFGFLRPHIISYKNNDGDVSMENVRTIITKVRNATKFDRTVIRLNSISGGGTLTLALQLTGVAATSTTYVASGAMTGPALAAAVKTTLEAVTDFNTHYTAKVFYDRVEIKAKVEGTKDWLNVGVSGLSGVGLPNASLSYWRRACKPDFVLVSSHPNNTSQTNELQPEDLVLQTIAEEQNAVFVNCRKGFPPFDDMTKYNTLLNDGYHLRAFTGVGLETALVYDEINRYLRLQTAGPNVPFQYIITAPNDYSPFFSVVRNAGAGAHRSDEYSVYYTTDGAISEKFGINYVRCKRRGDPYHMFMAGGNAGLGFNTTTGVRYPAGFFEIFSGGSNIPNLVLSGHTGMTADVLEIRTGAGTGSGQTGSRAGGIKGTGLADFPALTLPPVAFASLPASPATNMFATINNGPAFVAGNDANGSGSGKMLVQWNGTTWKMVLQLY